MRLREGAVVRVKRCAYAPRHLRGRTGIVVWGYRSHPQPSYIVHFEGADDALLLEEVEARALIPTGRVMGEWGD